MSASKYRLAVEMGPGGELRTMRDTSDSVSVLPQAAPTTKDAPHNELVAALKAELQYLQDVRLIGYDCPPLDGTVDYLSDAERWWSNTPPYDASKQLNIPMGLYTDQEALHAYLSVRYGPQQYGLIIVNDGDSNQGGAVRTFLWGKEELLRLYSNNTEEGYMRWVCHDGKLSTAGDTLRAEIFRLRCAYPVPRVFLWSPSGVDMQESGGYSQPPNRDSPCKVTVITDPYAALRGALLLGP